MEESFNSNLLKPFKPMEPFGTSNFGEQISSTASDSYYREEKNEQTKVTMATTEKKEEISKSEETYKLPDYYKPVEILSPLEMSEFLVNTSDKTDNINNGPSEKLLNDSEFKNKKIESSLREIISDLDYYTEKEMELKDIETKDPDKWKYQVEIFWILINFW